MKFKTLFITLVVSLFFVGIVQAADYGLKAAVNATGGALPTSIKGATTLPELAGVIVNVALSLLGIVFFGLMLYAGITWMKAMGSSEDVTKAKDIMQAAIIGLIIVGAAYAITSFVFSSLGQSGGPASGGGGGTIVQDGSACSDPAGGKGYKWNCRGGSGVKSCSSDVAFCDSPCRFNSSKSTCMLEATCKANPAWKAGNATSCPGSEAGTICCLTDVTQDK
jgi:hypothetical protein